MSSMMMYDLDKVIEGIDLKGVTSVKPGVGYYDDNRRYLEYEGMKVTLRMDNFSKSLSVALPNTTYVAENVERLGHLLVAATKIHKAWDKVAATARKKELAEREKREKEYAIEREKLRAEREKERAEAARLAEIRAVKVKEREERMLNEFLGDEVRVKVRGFKSKVRAHVRSREIKSYGDTEAYWQPYLEYVLDQNWHWPKDINSVILLEVKIGGRFEKVWDDTQGEPVVGRRSVPKRRSRRRVR